MRKLPCPNPFDAAWPEDPAPLLTILDATIVRLRPRVRERIATPSEHAAYHEAMIARSLVRDQYQATSAAA